MGANASCLFREPSNKLPTLPHDLGCRKQLPRNTTQSLTRTRPIPVRRIGTGTVNRDQPRRPNENDNHPPKKPTQYDVWRHDLCYAHPTHAAHLCALDDIAILRIHDIIAYLRSNRPRDLWLVRRKEDLNAHIAYLHVVYDSIDRYPALDMVFVQEAGMYSAE